VLVGEGWTDFFGEVLVTVGGDKTGKRVFFIGSGAESCEITERGVGGFFGREHTKAVCGEFTREERGKGCLPDAAWAVDRDEESGTVHAFWFRAYCARASWTSSWHTVVMLTSPN